jgi:hypothetical protein
VSDALLNAAAREGAATVPWWKPAHGGAIAAMAAVIALRFIVLFRYRINSDETQHLHVVWSWAHGLLPYRDFFDNHMPLFHVLFVPLLRLAGERPETLLLARMAMVPLYALMAWLTYRIARTCLAPRAAFGAVLIGMLAPEFFLCSIEFRTDVLWTVFWLAAILILLRGPVTVLRCAAAGLMLGLAAGVSAKTSLLVASLVVAAAFSLLRRSPVKAWMALLGGAIVPPALIAAYFAARGVWKAFVYCTVTHNVVSPVHPYHLLLVFPSILLIVVSARKVRHAGAGPLFILLTALIYATALLTLWPIDQTEHWLPCYPLAAIALFLLVPRNQTRIMLAIVAAELLGIVDMSVPWRDEVTPSMTLIAEAMRLTSPEERVLDLKGEFVFRRRATYFVFEKITKKKIASGDLRDTIAEDVVRTHTMVVVPDNSSFPQDGRAFLTRNFMQAGALRVAGMIIAPDRPFRIEVPAEYSVVPEHGQFHGSIDGIRYLGPRHLTAGSHTLITTSPGVPIVLMWSRAAILRTSPLAARRLVTLPRLWRGLSGPRTQAGKPAPHPVHGI